MKPEYVYTNGFLGRRRLNHVMLACVCAILCFIVLICSHFYGEYKVAQDREAIERTKTWIAYKCMTQQQLRMELGDIRVIKYEWYPNAGVALVGIRSDFHEYEGFVAYGEGFRNGGEIRFLGQTGQELWNTVSFFCAIIIVALGLFVALEFLLAGIQQHKRNRYYYRG